MLTPLNHLYLFQLSDIFSRVVCMYERRDVRMFRKWHPGMHGHKYVCRYAGVYVYICVPGVLECGCMSGHGCVGRGSFLQCNCCGRTKNQQGLGLQTCMSDCKGPLLMPVPGKD